MTDLTGPAHIPSSQALADIVEGASIACLYWSSCERTWLVSPGFCAVLGLASVWGEWRDDALGSLLHSDDAFDFMSLLEGLKGGAGAGNVQCRFRHAAGDWRSLSGHATVTGSCSLIVFHDNTNAIQTEAALVDSQMRLRGLYDAAPVSIVLWGRDGRITDWNQMAERVLGYSRSQAMGLKLVPTLIDPVDYQRFSDCVSSAMETNTEVQLTCRTVVKGGSLIRCEWHTVPLRNVRGALMGLFSIALDVTERNLASAALKQSKDDAERLSQAKTEFLATISHELRTPLNGVLGMAQVILSLREQDHELREYVGVIKENGDQLLSIVDAILTYTSLDMDSALPEKDLLSAVDVCSIVAENFSFKAKNKGIELNVDLDGLGDALIPGSRERLELLLMCLMDNAVRFTENGAISFSARHQNDALCISIHDTGCGIPEGFMPQLFMPFRQADSSFSRKHGGLGMGLATAKKLADNMHADLSIASPQGKGVTASLRIPIRA